MRLAARVRAARSRLREGQGPRAQARWRARVRHNRGRRRSNPALDVTDARRPRRLGGRGPASRACGPSRRQGLERGQDAAAARRGGPRPGPDRRRHRRRVSGPAFAASRGRASLRRHRRREPGGRRGGRHRAGRASALFDEPGPPVSAEYARLHAAYRPAPAPARRGRASRAAFPARYRDRRVRRADPAGRRGRRAGACTDSIRRRAAPRRRAPAVVKPTSPAGDASAGPGVGRRRRAAAWPGPPDELRGRGAEAVVVSLGADGLLAVTGDGTWLAARAARRPGPDRAGDAARRRARARPGARAGPGPSGSGRPPRWARRRRRARSPASPAWPTTTGPCAGELRIEVAAGASPDAAASAASIVGRGPAAARRRAPSTSSRWSTPRHVAGARGGRAPVILQISENCVAYHGGWSHRAGGARGGQARPRACAVRLDHATDPGLVREAGGLGSDRSCSTRPALLRRQRGRDQGNGGLVSRSRHLARGRNSAGSSGKAGAHDPRIRTPPRRGGGLVTETGADALAMTVGSSHAMLTRDAAPGPGADRPDPRRACPVPAGASRSSGVPDDGLAAAMKAGLTKMESRPSWTRCSPRRTGPPAPRPSSWTAARILDAGREAVAREVARLLAVLEAAMTPHARTRAELDMVMIGDSESGMCSSPATT